MSKLWILETLLTIFPPPLVAQAARARVEHVKQSAACGRLRTSGR
jgi:hypothetical protein